MTRNLIRDTVCVLENWRGQECLKTKKPNHWKCGSLIWKINSLVVAQAMPEIASLRRPETAFPLRLAIVSLPLLATVSRRHMPETAFLRLLVTAFLVTVLRLRMLATVSLLLAIASLRHMQGIVSPLRRLVTASLPLLPETAFLRHRSATVSPLKMAMTTRFG